ncbi:MAG: phasin family protein [Pseudomonadota bacterium]
MPKADPKPNGTGANPMKMHLAPFDMEPIIAANQRSFQAAAEAQNHMMKRLALMNKELFGFFNRRLIQDREMAHELARCKTPQDAVAICAKFAETAVKDYSEEVGVLAGAYAEQAQEVMEDVQHQVEETIDVKSKKGA